jgi:hypothetical protein
MSIIDYNATIDAIRILRALDTWTACDSIGQDIRTRAYIRLERELRNYLTGEK